MFNRIFELAIPKGNVSAKCEICGNKATTKCETCRVTHYCSNEHKAIDAISFHKKVCEKLAEIRSDRPLPFSEDDRIAEKEYLLRNKRAILRLAETITRKWLLEEKPMNAYPSAMIAWNMASDLGSSDDTEVIVPTCLVSEVFLNLSDLKTAQDYMVQASWLSQKYETLPAEVLSKLYRLRGLVFMKSQNWEQARAACAEFVYAMAVEHGISDIRMGVPLGLLGLCLLKFDNIDGALSSFHRMTDKWLAYLLDRYEDKNMRAATEAEMMSDRNIEEVEFQLRESKIVFRWVYEAIRELGMNATTDLINFKILSLQVLCQIRENDINGSAVYKQEAMATSIRTKQDRSVSKDKIPSLIEVLGDDFILRWEKKHLRPRTIATKYLEMIKALDI